MTELGLRRCALPGVISATLILAGCGDSNPYGPPYYDLGTLLAGAYSPTTEGGSQGMRLVLGRRHTVTGRYDGAGGDVVRFEGSWERVGGRVVITLQGPGVPPTMDLGYNREKVLTPIPRGQFSQQSETEQNFLEQDIMRLTGAVVVAGTPVQLDLARVITDVITIGGGGTS